MGKICSFPYRLFVAFFLLVVLSGCATLGGSDTVAGNIPQKQKSTVAPGNSGVMDAKGWSYARFRIDWPEGDDVEPNWAMDTLLANEVFRPVLEKHRDKIELWRFHRRAGRKWGHVFSFIFYSTGRDAKAIYDDIERSPVMKKLVARKKIEWIKGRDFTKNKRPEIEDTSDKAWSLVMQQTWPSFIMGVSQTWLDMVSIAADDQPKALSLEGRYNKVQDIVTGVWQREGRHAFMHHLNAIYGYQPMFMWF